MKLRQSVLVVAMSALIGQGVFAAGTQNLYLTAKTSPTQISQWLADNPTGTVMVNGKGFDAAKFDDKTAPNPQFTGSFVVEPRKKSDMGKVVSLLSTIAHKYPNARVTVDGRNLSTPTQEALIGAIGNPGLSKPLVYDSIRSKPLATALAANNITNANMALNILRDDLVDNQLIASQNLVKNGVKLGIPAGNGKIAYLGFNRNNKTIDEYNEKGQLVGPALNAENPNVREAAEKLLGSSSEATAN